MAFRGEPDQWMYRQGCGTMKGTGSATPVPLQVMFLYSKALLSVFCMMSPFQASV
jgi:hypothetical protein